MSLGGSQNTHTEEPKVLSLLVNQSAYGTAKARVWGKARVPGNMLWYGNFTAIPHTDTQKTGGKGAPKTTSSSTSYTYTAAFVLGLATGPIAGVGTVWMDKSVSDTTTLGLTLKSGQLRQAPWSYLTSNVPDQAVSYSGIAYLAASSFDLGTSTSQPNLSFEVLGERIIPGGDDAQAADVISDIVSDPLNGLGLSDVLADMTDYSTWCAAMGLTVAVAATSQRAARDYLTDLLSATLAEPVWSNGQIKLVPYGDEPVGAWTPNTTPVYDITEDDLQDAPVETRTQPSEATNRIILNFTSRAKDYNTSTVTRDDLSSVTQYGVNSQTMELSCITREEMATVVAEFWRDRDLYIRNQWELSVDEHLCLLEPMDLATLTFAPKNLYQVPVRVVEVDDDGQGKITLTVEEWPFGMLKPTAIPMQTATPFVPQQQVAPGPANTPVVFQAPNAMTAPNLEVWIGTSGGPDWGGANVWVSDDNQTYQQVGSIFGPARHGVLSTGLPAAADPDTGSTAYVDMSISHGQLLSASQASADSGDTLFWLDGEVMAYGTSTLTAVDKYSLTYLRRGMNGTPISAHATGAQFLRLDQAVFEYVVPKERYGRPIWIKLQSFNKYGASLEPLSTVTPHQFTLTGNKPSGVASLAAAGGLFLNTLTWSFVANQPDRDYTELWGATTNDRSQAFQLSSQKNPGTSWTHPGLQPGQTWYYWARVVDTSGNESDFYPASATAGVACAPTSDPSALLQQLTNAIGTPQLAAELAMPIVQSTPQAHLNALASLQGTLDEYQTATLVRWHETVTNAIITTDPASGKIQLLATADVTTDVESRLTYVEQLADANEGQLQGTVAQLESVQDGLTSAQTQITQVANSIASSASTVYVDQAVAGATGLTVSAANSAQALAQAAIQDSLDAFASAGTQRNLAANVAIAQQNIQTNADATTALVKSQAALVAVVSDNAAAFAQEQSVMADQISAEADARQALAARMSGAEAAIATEQQARASADGVNASAISAVQVRMSSAESAISNEQQARATADAANASSISAVTARMTNAEAAISNEQQARASGDDANASSINTISARLNSGDFAAVKQQSSATASAVSDLQAQWSVQVQTMQDGKLALAGIEVLSGGQQQSTVAILADRLLVYKPDGSGAPQQMLILGKVNGVTALGLSGDLIVDGGITGRSLAAGSVTADKANIQQLSALAADLGVVIAGLLRNSANTNYVNLNATGTQPFIKVGNAIAFNADGSGFMARPLISAPNVVASGNLSVNSGTIGFVVTSGVDSEGNPTSGGGYVGFDYLIDTGIQVSNDWAQAATDMYLASVTISGGSSVNGGCNGYSKAELVVGDGLLNGAQNSPIDNRLYIHYQWIAVGPDQGQVTITSLNWKVVKI